MLKKKKIMIIAHFCDYGLENSNNRFNYLAELLAKEYEVELVTSSFSHRDKIQRVKLEVENKKYKTTLIYEPSYQKNISLKRLVYSHPMMARNLAKYLQATKAPDMIYCAVPSLSVAHEAAKYCRTNNVRFAVDVQDLWPEAFQMISPFPIVSKFLFSPMKLQADFIYKNADLIFGVSNEYVERAKTVNRRCRSGDAIYIGTELKFFDSNVKKHIGDVLPKKTLWLGYCGTLGNSYDIITILDALALLKEKGASVPRFIIMGSGPQKTKFESYAVQKKVDAVFLGSLPYPVMCAWLASCDIVVNPIRNGSAASIINKHADYAASGKAVINTQESAEYRDLVEKYNMGFNCQNGNVQEISKYIEILCNDSELREKMGHNARICAEEAFDRAYSYQIIANRISKLIG